MWILESASRDQGPAFWDNSPPNLLIFPLVSGNLSIAFPVLRLTSGANLSSADSSFAFETRAMLFALTALVFVSSFLMLSMRSFSWSEDLLPSVAAVVVAVLGLVLGLEGVVVGGLLGFGAMDLGALDMVDEYAGLSLSSESIEL